VSAAGSGLPRTAVAGPLASTWTLRARPAVHSAVNTELDEPRLEQLERAIAVLRTFDAEHPRLTAGEVAQLTESTRASARRILLMFKSLGHMRSDGRHFSLPPASSNRAGTTSPPSASTRWRNP
jgi:IclR helix-turn-helix domain